MLQKRGNMVWFLVPARKRRITGKQTCSVGSTFKLKIQAFENKHYRSRHIRIDCRILFANEWF
jgi:hypothetical protein